MDKPTTRPGLTQGFDYKVEKICNASHLPEHCDGSKLCSCSHVIQLELNKCQEVCFVDMEGELIFFISFSSEF